MKNVNIQKEIPHGRTQHTTFPVRGLLGDGILQVLNVVVEARRPLHEHNNTQYDNMNVFRHDTPLSSTYTSQCIHTLLCNFTFV